MYSALTTTVAAATSVHTSGVDENAHTMPVENARPRGRSMLIVPLAAMGIGAIVGTVTPVDSDAGDARLNSWIQPAVA